MRKKIMLVFALAILGACAARAQTLEEIREIYCPASIDDIILALPVNVPGSKQLSASSLSSSVDKKGAWS